MSGTDAQRLPNGSADGHWEAPAGYADLMLARMAEQRISLRTLAGRCDICKSRLGGLLHRDPTRRSEPTLTEFLVILRALDLSIFEAVICAEALDPSAWRAPRYASAIAMLSRLFKELPAVMLAALAELDELDGSEVRPEWAVGLERAVVKRVVQEINAVAARRAAAVEFTF